jgi:leucyl aminopeptidase
MNISLSLLPLTEVPADALVVLTCEGELPKDLHPWVADLEASGEFTGKPAELAIIPQPAGFAAKRLVLCGLGKPERRTGENIRKAAGTAIRALKARSLKRIALATGAGHVMPAVEGGILGDWEPDEHKSKKEAKRAEELVIAVPGGDPSLQSALERGRILAEAQNAARDLAHQPGNLLTPLVLAQRARAMALETGLTCEVLDEAAMREKGFGALLGVAQGSAEPPVLIILRYRPAQPQPQDVSLALVGKGVTFDTGGISIKPSEGMEKMKYDMSGAATMLGAMQAIAKLSPALAVTAYIPSVENMPGSRAQRPGDIVRSLSGKTVEVLNTDAEGRLILIDAITHAKSEGATHVIDAATLTGAIGVALGNVRAGAFSNDQPLMDRVLDSSRALGEKMWQMPLDEEYREMLKSPYADMPNISGGRGGGAITAAKFLEEWTDGTPWVHLDIANVAWLDDAKPWMSKGPTGFGVRTLASLVLHWQ